MSIKTANLADRLTYIEKVVTDKNFRSNDGLGRDVPYYIFDYDAKDELIVTDYLSQFIRRINAQNLGFSIVEYDLYELILEYLESKNYLNMCFDLEQESDYDSLSSIISDMIVDPIIETICKDTPPNSIVFLTGIGKSYPIIRAHTIISNLQQVFYTMPVVVFYPGKYTGHELQLFGTINGDNHYRALFFPKP